jgi:hypothetical protein
VIAERTRRDANSLFATSNEPETAAELTLPTIIEVPQWLSRLEQKLAAQARDVAASVEEPTEQPPKDQDPPATQQELF